MSDIYKRKLYLKKIRGFYNDTMIKVITGIRRYGKSFLLKSITKELESVIFEIERSEKMLSNPNFVNKAPTALVEKEKEKLEANKALKNTIMEKLK